MTEKELRLRWQSRQLADGLARAAKELLAVQMRFADGSYASQVRESEHARFEARALLEVDGMMIETPLGIFRRLRVGSEVCTLAL